MHDQTMPNTGVQARETPLDMATGEQLQVRLAEAEQAAEFHRARLEEAERAAAAARAGLDVLAGPPPVPNGGRY